MPDEMGTAMKRLIVAAVLALGLVSPAKADYQSGRDAYQRGDYAASFRVWEPLAQAGDAKAQFGLGGLFERGRGVPLDRARAFRWYGLAAKQKFGPAQKAVSRFERLYPGLVRRARIEARQEAELKRFREEKQKARQRARQARPGKRRPGSGRGGGGLNIPVPPGWDGYKSDRLDTRLTAGLEILLGIPVQKRLFLPPGQKPGNWSELILVDQAQQSEGTTTPLGLYRAWIRDVIAGCENGRETHPPANSGKGPGWVKSTYACAKHKNQDFGSFAMMKALKGPEDLFLVRRVWRGPPYPVDDIGAMTGRFGDWEGWFDRVAMPRPRRARNRLRPSAGFGFIVNGQGHIVTPHHVVKGCRRLRFSSSGARLLAIDPVRNLALYKLRKKPKTWARFREGEEARKGDPIIVASYPREGTADSDLSVSAGVIGGLTGPGGDSRFLALTAAIQPGTSGAPLLDLHGNIAGMVFSAAEAARMAQAEIPDEITGFALNAQVIKTFLKGQGAPFETAPAETALTPALAGDKARSFTVSVDCQK